jgi:hypothetical protein
LKNTHLLRYVHPSSLQRTGKYASFLRISRALHLDVFEQPEENYFFNNLLISNNRAMVTAVARAERNQINLMRYA